MISNNI